MNDGLVQDAQGVKRCFWCVGAPDYVEYHDLEWGSPVVDDRMLFEKICLEGFQAGLSWLTILRKREAFRAVFCGFDFVQVARFSKRQVNALSKDPSIVRHRGKIESVINNAARAEVLVQEFGSLSAYFWPFQPHASSRPRRVTRQALMKHTTSPESVAMSKDLKKRGWTYVGPTTLYAFMQAMGLVNDHIEGCHVRAAVELARAKLSQ